MIVSITDYHYFLGTETFIYSKWAWLSLDLIPAPGFDFRVYMASLGYIKTQAYTVRLYQKKNEQKLVLLITLQLLVRNLEFASWIQVNCASLRTGLFA